MAKVAEVIIRGVLKEKGWEIDVREDWNKITGHKWIITAENDSMITGAAQLINQVSIASGQRIVHLNAKHSMLLEKDTEAWTQHCNQLSIAFNRPPA